MKYFEVIKGFLPLLEQEQENMEKAGQIIADTIMNGGIVQTFGSGHSYGGAIEIAGRAGGLLPVKAVYEETFGRYERIEGVGSEFVKYWDLRENDCVIIISNSGRNPFIIELALFAKSKKVPLIAVTALEVSKKTPSRHSSGKRLFEIADVVLDNHSVDGDAAVEIEGLRAKVGGTSSISTDLLLNQTVIFAIEEMLSKGFEPPVLLSANIDGGPEFNERLMEKYKESVGYRITLKK
ncbi:MAG: SIS domain-containing protein [Caldisericaceae bacterium]